METRTGSCEHRRCAPIRLRRAGASYGLWHPAHPGERLPRSGHRAGYAFAEDDVCLLADAVVTLSVQRSRWFGTDGNTINLGGGGVDNLDSDLYHQWVNQDAACRGAA